MTHYWRIAFFLSFSICVSLVIHVYPANQYLAMIRPELLSLLVIYWVVSRPHQLGVAFAWCLGLFQDIVQGNVWGAHALALTVLAYICLLSWQRIRSYSIWQQSMWVFVLVGTHQVIVSWIQSLAGYHTPTYVILLPTLSSALLWPLISALMLRLQKRLRILQSN